MLAVSPPSESEPVEAPPDLMGVRECAKAVGVNASTISRQLANGLFQDWGSPGAPKISLAEVKSVRAKGLDPAQQRQAPTRRGARPDSGYAHERAEREKLNRRSAELDLAERLNAVLDRAQVEDDFETFARALRERLRQRNQTLVMELDQLPTSAAKIAHLDAADEKMLAELSDQLESLAGAAGA